MSIFVKWMHKSRNMVGIPIEMSHNRNMIQMCCGFRLQKETLREVEVSAVDLGPIRPNVFK